MYLVPCMFFHVKFVLKALCSEMYQFAKQIIKTSLGLEPRALK